MVGLAGILKTRESQNESGWKGPQWVICSILPATLHGIVSRQFFNISSEEDSTTSPGNLFQRSSSSKLPAMGQDSIH